jgi:predicted RNase H-like nuclease (RuvC/YqgF family)
MFSGPLAYVSGGLLVVALALGAALWVQTERNQAKAERIDALELAVGAWERKVAAKEATIATLRAKLDEQSAAVEEAARLGRLAEERQATIDRLMAELARAEDDLRVIADKYRQLREQAVGLDECQTFRMALEAIAGAVP